MSILLTHLSNNSTKYYFRAFKQCCFQLISSQTFLLTAKEWTYISIAMNFMAYIVIILLIVYKTEAAEIYTCTSTSPSSVLINILLKVIPDGTRWEKHRKQSFGALKPKLVEAERRWAEHTRRKYLGWITDKCGLVDEYSDIGGCGTGVYKVQ